MTPIIAAKNMAGKETVDSNMLSACSLPAPIHNAIVCANRKFCWQRLLYCKATARGAAAPRVGGVSKLYRRFGPRSEIFLLDKAVQKVSQGFFTSKFRGKFGFETVAVQPDSKRFGPPLNFPRPFAQMPSAFNCNKKIARKDVGTLQHNVDS
jgi:hypothetical protein